jgi:hypothetical protein
MEKKEIVDRQPRRRFLTTLLSGIAGAAALLSVRKRAGAEAKKTTAAPNTDPILYHRNEESERYYRTLYR